MAPEKPLNLSSAKVVPPWYKQQWLLWLSMVIFPPLGIGLTWLTDWSPKRKKITSGAGVAWFALMLASGGPEAEIAADKQQSASEQQVSSRSAAPREAISFGILFPDEMKSESATSRLIQADGQGELRITQALDEGNVDGVLTAYERIEGDSVSYTGEFQERDQAGTCSGSFEIRELKQYNWQLKRTYKGGNGCEFVGDTIATDFYKVGSDGELMGLPIASTGDIYIEDGGIPSGAPLPEHSALPVFFENRNQSYMALEKEVGSMGQLYMVKVDLGSKGKTSVVSNCTDINTKGEQADLRVGNPSSTRDFYFSEYPGWFLRAASHFCGPLEIEELHEPREVAEASSNYLQDVTLNENLVGASYQGLSGGVLEDSASRMVIEYKKSDQCGNGKTRKNVSQLTLNWNTRSWFKEIIWDLDCLGNEVRNDLWGEGSFRNPREDYLELDSLDTDGSLLVANRYEIYVQGLKTAAPPVAQATEPRELSYLDESQSTKEEALDRNSNYPKATCGDPASPGAEWFPVFVDNGDLESIRAEWCSDAIAKTRPDTGVSAVQLASFTDSARAGELASLVGGEVGESYFLDN